MEKMEMLFVCKTKPLSGEFCVSGWVYKAMRDEDKKFWCFA